VSESVNRYMATNAENAWRSVRNAKISTMLCPVDSGAETPYSGQGGDWARGNYGANAGPALMRNSANADSNIVAASPLKVTIIRPTSNGYPSAGYRLEPVMSVNFSKPLPKITDGTTNTAMATEIVLVADTGSHDIRGRYHNPAHGGVLFTTRIPPNTNVPDQFNWCSSAPPAKAPCIWTGTNMFLSPRSYHTGGVNLLLADGSVRFIQNTVTPQVFINMGSRSGGEVPGDF